MIGNDRIRITEADKGIVLELKTDFATLLNKLEVARDFLYDNDPAVDIQEVDRLLELAINKLEVASMLSIKAITT